MILYILLHSFWQESPSALMAGMTFPGLFPCKQGGAGNEVAAVASCCICSFCSKLKATENKCELV